MIPRLPSKDSKDCYLKVDSVNKQIKSWNEPDFEVLEGNSNFYLLALNSERVKIWIAKWLELVYEEKQYFPRGNASSDTNQMTQKRFLSHLSCCAVSCLAEN